MPDPFGYVHSPFHDWELKMVIQLVLQTTQDPNLRLVTAVEQAAESIVITDVAARLLYVNPAFERLTGYSRQEVVGQNPRVLQSGAHDAEFYRHTASSGRRAPMRGSRYATVAART